MKLKWLFLFLLLPLLTKSQGAEEKPRVSLIGIQADYGFLKYRENPSDQLDILAGTNLNLQFGYILKLQLSGSFPYGDNAARKIFKNPSIGFIFDSPSKRNDFFMQMESMVHNPVYDKDYPFATSIGFRLGKTIKMSDDSPKFNMHLGSKYYSSTSGSRGNGLVNVFIGLGFWLY